MGTFCGGFFLSSDKTIQDKPIEQVSLPEKVVIPLKQYVGVPCEVKVKKGDEVKAGQVIGESADPNSIPTHATTSGKVADIVKRFPHYKGDYVSAVVIEPDGKNEWLELPKASGDYLQKSPDDLLNLIRQAGVADFDIDSIPLHAKLSQAREKSINTLIINGIDIEPFLASRYRLLVERAQDIASGIEILKKVLGASAIYIAVSKDIPVLRSAISGNATRIVTLKAKFPQALEKLLVKSILNKEIPPEAAASDTGASIHDVETVLAVLEAARDAKPVVEKVFTLAGDGVNNPKNLRARIGTPIDHIVQHGGGFTGTPGKLIIGGPLMGVAQYTTEIPVTKETSGVFIQPEVELGIISTEKCFNCGMCVKACPMRLLPHVISAYCEIGEFEKAEGYYLAYCIDCGCCSYVCPAKIPLLQWIRYGKSEIVKRVEE